jgi:hypothetical protein
MRVYRLLESAEANFGLMDKNDDHRRLREEAQDQKLQYPVFRLGQLVQSD